jgi:superfamily II RNA helicase
MQEKVTSSKDWAVMDTIDVKNFKQMIPEPAIDPGFELDTFQKRAVYRLE